MSFSDLRRLVLAMSAAGHRVFNLIYHSPSIVAGNTPYVRSEAERQAFHSTIERFLEFFLGELGGAAITLTELRARVIPVHLSISNDVRRSGVGAEGLAD
jgi:hypothetical protein